MVKWLIHMKSLVAAPTLLILHASIGYLSFTARRLKSRCRRNNVRMWQATEL